MTHTQDIKGEVDELLERVFAKGMRASHSNEPDDWNKERDIQAILKIISRETERARIDELGLPVGKMTQVLIAFDVDGTLISNETEPNEPPIANERIRSLLITLASFKNTKILVWSGGGEVYARQAVNSLGLSKYVDKYAAKDPYIQPDIAIDDIQDTAIGKLNLIVREK